MKIASIKVEYVDHIYAAGFLDGEGCFTINNSIQLKCAHTHLPTLKFLQKIYGGSLREHKHESHKKPAWVWSVCSATAVNCINHIFPFLKEKKEKAQILLEYQKTMGTRGKRVSKEIIDLRKKLKEIHESL